MPFGTSHPMVEFATRPTLSNILEATEVMRFFHVSIARPLLARVEAIEERMTDHAHGLVSPLSYMCIQRERINSVIGSA